MIKLRFVIDEDLLLAHILGNHSSHAPFLRLKKRVWEYDPSFYYLTSQKVDPLIMEFGLSSGITKTATKHTQAISFVKRSPEFRKALIETEKYASAVEKEWNSRYPISAMHMDTITKMDVSTRNETITVYILHPLLQCGRSYIDQHAITWSHKTEWKDYAVVYLWHEIMHHITYGKSKTPHLMHSIIELCCDNELRIRLHGRGHYFKENGIDIGHRYLMTLNKILLPDWRKYLKKSNETIYQFERRMMKLHHNEALAKTISPLAEWAEWH